MTTTAETEVEQVETATNILLSLASPRYRQEGWAAVEFLLTRAESLRTREKWGERKPTTRLSWRVRGSSSSRVTVRELGTSFTVMDSSNSPEHVPNPRGVNSKISPLCREPSIVEPADVDIFVKRDNKHRYFHNIVLWS